LICNVLEQRGFLVLEAKDSKEAIDLAVARKESIHLIVTDLIVPETIYAGPVDLEGSGSSRC
jgi:hypothetical protein